MKQSGNRRNGEAETERELAQRHVSEHGTITPSGFYLVDQITRLPSGTAGYPPYKASGRLPSRARLL
jgi:hypothetical protein